MGGSGVCERVDAWCGGFGRRCVTQWWLMPHHSAIVVGGLSQHYTVSGQGVVALALINKYDHHSASFSHETHINIRLD